MQDSGSFLILDSTSVVDNAWHIHFCLTTHTHAPRRDTKNPSSAGAAHRRVLTSVTSHEVAAADFDEDADAADEEDEDADEDEEESPGCGVTPDSTTGGAAAATTKPPEKCARTGKCMMVVGANTAGPVEEAEAEAAEVEEEDADDEAARPG